MPNNKVKSRTGLQGKKGMGAKKMLHPHSRRAKQVNRVSLREDKLAEKQKERNRLVANKIDQLLWFALAMDPDVEALDMPALHNMVVEHLARNDEEIQSHVNARRPGRPKTKRHEVLEAEKEREQREYETDGGLLIPDMTDKIAVANLRYWQSTLNGKPGFLPRLRLVRIFKGKDVLAVHQEGSKSITRPQDELAGDGDHDDDQAMDVEEEDHDADEA